MKTNRKILTCGPVQLPAYAKINLVLELLGRRVDGFTEISSVVVPVSLHDDIAVRVASSDSLTVVAEGVSAENIGPSEDNLCMRAVRLFRERAGFEEGIAVEIVKRIPIGGGLGGGSADCAATLKALNSLFEEPPFTDAELMSMAAELGSDIPALVHGGAVEMKGRGEIVETFAPSVPHYFVVLVNPGTHVSTAAAYKSVPDGISRRTESVPELKSVLTSAPFSDTIANTLFSGVSLSAFAACLFNGLEPYVFNLEPSVREVSRLLKEAGAKAVLMSGSGATCFALAATEEEANFIARAMPADYWCGVSELLPDGVMAAHGPLEA